MTRRVRVSTLIRHLKEFPRGHWIQGNYEDGQGNYCIVGWLDHLDYYMEDITDDLVRINDKEGQTEEGALAEAVAYLESFPQKTLEAWS